MDWELIAPAVWAVAAVVVTIAVAWYYKKKGTLDTLAFVMDKADSLLDWVHAEFPDIPAVEEIDKIVEMIQEEIRKYKLTPVDSETIKTEVIAAKAYRSQHYVAVSFPQGETTQNTDI